MSSPRRERRPGLASIEEIAYLIHGAVQRSAADETEIAWIELQRGRVAARGQRMSEELATERTILTRVIDRGRVGSYRTGAGEPGELDNAVRLAVAQSRVRQPVPGLAHLPAEAAAGNGQPEIHDRAIADLTIESAANLLRDVLEPRESAELQWCEARVALCNSRSVRRKAGVTAIQISVAAGSASATSAARRLDELDAGEVGERARARASGSERAALPERPLSLVLSPEASISLVELLAETSFSARAYHDGTSFLREHLGVQVFDRSLHLRDDATDPAGLPFPFDLEGTLKRPVDLIRDGIPRTPALDQRQAAILGLPSTAHAIGGNNARAEHLFLEPGELREAEILEAAEGGLWVSSLSGLETIDPLRLRFRARAHGARRIEQGRLGRPVAGFRWEDSLLRAFADLGGIGCASQRRLSPDGYLGGISAPAVWLRDVGDLTPL
jgi:predicted Zn-dependent protease